MKKLLITFTLLLSGCAQESQNLILMCEGLYVDGFTVNGRFHSTEKKISKAYNFENKTVEQVPCEVWNKDRIECIKKEVDKEGETNFSLILDRRSGLINHIHTYKHINGTGLTNKFGGACEKVKQNKI